MKKMLIPLSTDWLALSLDLKSSVVGVPNGHTWAYYSATNVWNSRWCLFNEFGEKIFTLLFQPRQSIIRGSAALLEVANEWLYHGIGEKGVLGLLAEVCKFEVTGISRLDLAADFCPSKRQKHIIEGLAKGKYYVGGKRNGSEFWSVIKDEYFPEMWQGRIPHCQSWGHKTSDVQWKLYYKTKELRDAVGGKGWDKPYIVDMWRDVGLDERNVWRLEVSIKNCNNFLFMEDKLTYERYRKSGSDLFQALYTSRFDVRRVQGHVDKSNDLQVPLLPVGRLSDAFKVERKDTLAEHNGRLSLIRHLVNDVQKEEVLLSEVSRESVLQTIEDVMEEDRFYKYFVAMVGEDFESWREWLRVKAYYFGEENIKPAMLDNQIERALLEVGVLRPEEGVKSLSAPNPQKSQQLNLFNEK